MLISTKKNFIFIHIKKTAGSSITNSLSRYDDRNLWLKILNTKLLTRIKYFRSMNPLSHHVSASQVKDYLGTDYDRYFTFAFVRNPFDWQVSNYFYIKQHELHPRNKEVRDLSFDEYLNWTLENNRIFLQSDFVADKSDNSKLLIDFVGKFENIDQDFLHILTEIGVESEVNLGMSNQSKRKKDYKQYYNNDSIDFIRTHYKVDLDNFNYDI